MEVAFIVKLNVDDVLTLPEYAGDISDDLLHAGHDVISVAPWQRPSLTQMGVEPTTESPFGVSGEIS